MSNSLQERPKNFALERPAFIKEGDVRGTENIGINDVTPPALRIAQSMSPETKRAEAEKYIDGLREGELFNSITREVYGEETVQIVIVNQLGHRHVEFDPDNRGVVLDFNVPDGDPRTEFTTGVKDGKQVRIKPRATKFYDYLVLLVHGDGRREMMTLSLKSTQLKKAKNLNTLLSGSKVPTFAHLFNATPVPEKRGNNNFYGWKFEPAGWVSEEIYNEASALYDQFKGKTIVVETEATDADESASDVPF